MGDVKYWHDYMGNVSWLNDPMKSEIEFSKTIISKSISMLAFSICILSLCLSSCLYFSLFPNYCF